MLIAILLAGAVAAPTKFDLVCKGHNTFVGFAGQKPVTYEERFSIDLAAGLFSDSDHVAATKIAKIDDQTVWLVQTFAPKVNQYLAVSRFDGSVSGQTDYRDGNKIDLSATCKFEPFSAWDHRKF
jgi:hypothetical protein